MARVGRRLQPLMREIIVLANSLAAIATAVADGLTLSDRLAFSARPG